MDMNRQRTAPVNVPRSRRMHEIFTLTSIPAGVMAPVAWFPMFREDSLPSTQVEVALEMMETYEVLLNPVNMRITAYFMPWLAMDRFEGSRDQFDRSYAGLPKVEGGATVNFFQTLAAGTHGANPIYKVLGEQAAAADMLNTMVIETVNQVWNFRARNRSKHLTERLLTSTSLPPAFWEHTRFRDILPSFDQKIIDGAVSLDVIDARLPVSGIGVTTGSTFSNVNQTVKDATTTNTGVQYPLSREAVSGGNIHIRGTASGATGVPDVYAEMTDNQISISLASIEMAKQLQSFAKLRQQYEGHTDDWIIDNLLLNGLNIPDQAWKQPMLIADTTVPVQQLKRMATDAANLAASATTGGARASVTLRMPQVSTGGIVMMFVECVPAQLFERQRNPFLYVDSVADLPEFQRDWLDPQKVEVVTNGEIDALHSTPNATFGYRPLNAKWNGGGPKIGGKFYKPASGTANDAERRRIWGIETVNPALAADFYTVTGMHTKPFLNTSADPFEVGVFGMAMIEGLTVMGPPLAEDNGNWEAVEAQVPTTQIDQ